MFNSFQVITWYHQVESSIPIHSDLVSSRFIQLFNQHNLRYFIITTIKKRQSSFFGRKSLHNQNRDHGVTPIGKVSFENASTRCLRKIASIWNTAIQISIQFTQTNILTH